MSFKILKFNCCGLDVHKTWIYACIGITDSNNRTEYKQARFPSFTRMSCVTGLPNITVKMFVWNQPESTGSLFSIS